MTYPIAQCNNVYIFPGVGLGAIVSQTPKIIDEMFITAARTLSAHSPMLKNPSASLFPGFTRSYASEPRNSLSIIILAQEQGL